MKSKKNNHDKNNNLDNKLEQDSKLSNVKDKNKTEKDKPELNETDILKNENQELKNKLMLSLADIENNRKNHNNEIEEVRKFANRKIILEIVKTLEIFDLAFNVPEDKKIDLKGFEMVYQELIKLLESYGVKIFTPKIGDEFDSNKHQVLDKIETNEYKPKHITKIYKKGYIMYDRIIQYPLVQIAQEKIIEKQE